MNDVNLIAHRGSGKPGQHLPFYYPAEHSVEIIDEPLDRRILMVGQQLRGSSKSMTSLLMLQQIRADLARNLEALDVKGNAFAGMLPWHEDKGSWSEFLRGEDPRDYSAPLSDAPGPRVVDLKRKAADRRHAKLAKASRKRNR